MTFNSFGFIFLFLPVILAIYFVLLHWKFVHGAKWFLITASIVFYGWANPYYAVLITSSILFNYYIAKHIHFPKVDVDRRRMVSLGIIINIAVLIVFKYYDFFAGMINPLLNTHMPMAHFGLAVGISFITFMQIAYLIQAYQGVIPNLSFTDYALFASFFPKLIIGPIAYFNELIPQLNNGDALRPNYDNLAKGIYIFLIGLFKKLVIADTLALIVGRGFDTNTTLKMTEAWMTSIAYTLQIYFDFSGYVDMAIGIAWMVNVQLPFNFNSPYQALNIKDFWKRWHITLTRFLVSYIYIPLGGNRKGELITLRNIMITFLISGFWHGAGWTFIFWGFLHGLAMVCLRLWERTRIRIPKFAAWFITLNFVNISWVFFRANSWGDALKVLQGMFGMTGLIGKEFLAGFGFFNIALMSLSFVSGFLLMIMPINSNYYSTSFVPTKQKLILQIVLVVICVMYLNMSVPKGFIYNDF